MAMGLNFKTFQEQRPIEKHIILGRRSWFRSESWTPRYGSQIPDPYTIKRHTPNRFRFKISALGAIPAEKQTDERMT
jgi:hypothetical protein